MRKEDLGPGTKAPSEENWLWKGGGLAWVIVKVQAMMGWDVGAIRL